MSRRSYTPQAEIFYAKASPAEKARLSATLRNRAEEMAEQRDAKHLEAYYTAMDMRRWLALHHPRR